MHNPDADERRVPCEVYSRIVGYLRPVQNWHAGKQQEYKERQEFVFPDLADPQPTERVAAEPSP